MLNRKSSGLARWYYLSTFYIICKRLPVLPVFVVVKTTLLNTVQIIKRKMVSFDLPSNLYARTCVFLVV